MGDHFPRAREHEEIFLRNQLGLVPNHEADDSAFVCITQTLNRQFKVILSKVLLGCGWLRLEDK